MKAFIGFYKKVYGLFGSGSHHAPHAIRMRQSRHHNNGSPIGLIRAADTRMAGYIIAFHRLLGMKPAIESTIASPKIHSASS
jgi:hypothetical protein